MIIWSSRLKWKLCREASETVSASRKLEVELRYDTELSELMIDTDDARLRQVLINLFVNRTSGTAPSAPVLRPWPLTA